MTLSLSLNSLRSKTRYVDGLDHSVSDTAELALKPRQLVVDHQLHDGHGEENLSISECLNRGVELRLVEDKRCVHCNKGISSTYASAYCFDCANSLAQCDLCILSPSKCHYHQGTCRDPEWADEFCMTSHTVYVALTSNTKVGITRSSRLHQRWIDQGAYAGVAIAQMPTRRAAGVLEWLLSRYISDRTDWRQLVNRPAPQVNLLELARQLRDQVADLQVLNDLNENPQVHTQLPAEEVIAAQWIDALQLVEIQHPLTGYSPAKRLTVNAQQPYLEANLLGLLGHFLLFDRGVLDLNQHRGMQIEVTFTDPKTHVQERQASLF